MSDSRPPHGCGGVDRPAACKANSYKTDRKTRHTAQPNPDLIFDWGEFTIHFNGSRKTCTRQAASEPGLEKDAAMTNEQLLAEIAKPTSPT